MLMTSERYWNIAQGQEVQQENIFSLDFLILEDGTDTMFRNVGKELPLDAT
jgi:hypothetical protein